MNAKMAWNVGGKKISFPNDLLHGKELAFPRGLGKKVAALLEPKTGMPRGTHSIICVGTGRHAAVRLSPALHDAASAVPVTDDEPNKISADGQKWEECHGQAERATV